MFQLPATVVLTIAATRMYRSLTDFVSGSADVYENFPSLLSLALTVIGDCTAHSKTSGCPITKPRVRRRLSAQQFHPKKMKCLWTPRMGSLRCQTTQAYHVAWTTRVS